VTDSLILWLAVGAIVVFSIVVQLMEWFDRLQKNPAVNGIVEARALRVALLIVAILLLAGTYKKLLETPAISSPVMIVKPPLAPILPDKKPIGPVAGGQSQSGRNNVQTGSITTAPCSAVQVGGSDNKQSVDCGPPDPTISWNQKLETVNGQLRASVVLTVDHSMEIPAFLATCDQPCTSLGASALGYSQSATLKVTNDSKKTGVVMLAPRPLGAGVKVFWGVLPTDPSATEIKVLSITKLAVQDLPSEDQ
jgi:hypothetical protein